MDVKQPIRVLLVEDNDYDAALLLMELRKGGYEPTCERVESAQAMKDALDRQSWDVLIADYVLPRFSGPDALKILQARGLDLPFIIVSGYIDEDTAVASMKAGAHDYVMKDRLKRLVPAIEREMEEAKVRGARRQAILERKKAENRLRVQYAVARVLSEANSLQVAAPRILKSIGESMDWEAGALWRIGAEGEGRQLRCAGIWRIAVPELQPFDALKWEKTFAPGEGLPGTALAEGRALWIADLSADPRFSGQEVAKLGLRGACAIPIRLGEELLGVIEFFSREAREPDENLVQWMASVGSQIGQFMEREMAQEALRQAHAELEQRVRERTADLMTANANLETSIRERRRLENELLEITEKERRRIGLDLHDDLGQKLAGIALMMKGLELSLTKKEQPESKDAQKISLLISQTVHHASDLARDLALGELDKDNLPSALEDLAENVRNLFGISCRFKFEGDIPALEKNTITQFYKITQEAVTNAVKHGKTKQVSINLVRNEDELVLTIRSNGLPFPSMIDKSKGMGLRIMTYRASVIGATLDIKPGRPNGTVVTGRLPVAAIPARNGKAAEFPAAAPIVR